MLSQNVPSTSKIDFLRKVLLEKQHELEKRNRKKSRKKSKYSKLYSYIMAFLLVAFIVQLFWLNKSGVFNENSSKKNKNVYHKQALLFQDIREKDSIKLKILEDKIAFYKEQREIDSILKEQEIIDSLFFEDKKLVVNVSFLKESKTSQKAVFRAKKNRLLL